MRKEFVKKVLADGRYDTKRYRYTAKPYLNGTVIVKRIRRDMLDTTAALTDASAANPDGWEVVAII